MPMAHGASRTGPGSGEATTTQEYGAVGTAAAGVVVITAVAGEGATMAVVLGAAPGTGAAYIPMAAAGWHRTTRRLEVGVAMRGASEGAVTSAVATGALAAVVTSAAVMAEEVTAATVEWPPA
jgi:hypothetical protein